MILGQGSDMIKVVSQEGKSDIVGKMFCNKNEEQ